MRTLAEIVRRQEELTRSLVPKGLEAVSQIANETRRLEKALLPDSMRLATQTLQQEIDRLQALQPKWWEVHLAREADRQRRLVTESVAMRLKPDIPPVWDPLRDSRRAFEEMEAVRRTIHASVSRIATTAEMPMHLKGITTAQNPIQRSMEATARELELLNTRTLALAGRTQLSDPVMQLEFASNLRRQLNAGYSSIDEDFLNKLADLVTQRLATASSAESIAALVRESVDQAGKSTTTNWHFIVSITVTALIFLYNLATGELKSRISEEEYEALRQEQMATNRMLEAMAAREVTRRTTLRTLPESSSRRVTSLLAGETVQVLERKGRWVKIKLLADAQGQSRLGQGWVPSNRLRLIP